MTTSATYSFIENISEPNPWINFGSLAKSRLSASVWVSARIGSIGDARLNCLRNVLGRVKDDFPSSQLWLIVTQRAVQSDNRITRFNRLWKSLGRQHIGLPSGDSVEHMVRSKQGLRFSGAAHFGIEDTEWAHQIMSREKASILVIHSHEAELAMKRSMDLGEVIQQCRPAPELRMLCEEHDAALVDVFGEFDDPETVVTMIGKRQLLSGAK